MKNIGAPGAQSSQRLNTTPGAGETREVNFNGTQQFVTAIYAAYKAAGYSASCDIKPGLCTVTVKDANESLQDDGTFGVEVSMQINRVHKSIYEPPSLGLSTFELADVQRAVNAASNTQMSETEFQDLTVGFTADMVILYELGIRKVEHRVVNQPILTKVTTAGRQHQFPAWAHDGVGDNYSGAAMLAEMGVTLQFPLPIFTDPLDSDIYYGWVKQMPSYSQVAGQRVSETVTFEFGAWSIDLYPLVG